MGLITKAYVQDDGLKTKPILTEYKSERKLKDTE